MEQIPKEVMEKIEAECEQVFNEFYGTIDEQLFRRGAEFGYRLLCEGKEKEIAELKAENERLKETFLCPYCGQLINHP